MKKVHYALLAVVVFIAATVLLWGCSQQEGSNPESVLSAKSGDLGGDDSDCSITVPEPEPEDLSSLALITAAQGEEAALAAYPDATIEEVELDNENGCLVYSVELSNGLELKIDAGNGEILYLESGDEDNDEDYEDEGDHEDEGDDDEDEGEGDVDEDEADPSYECSITVPDPEPEDLSSLALITVDQAQDAAQAVYPGTTVIEVELDNENGCLVYSVELSNGLEVKVDAGNGEILHVESDDDSGGDD
jgi:uncharacterized membrane protein YkoI